MSSEALALLLLAAVHFVNLVDFVMVMPMGPDFAAALNIPMSHLGIIGGAYTASATVAGILGSIVLDRYDRRSALTIAVAGLALSTAAAALASGAGTLIAARVAAGAFGGIAATLCFSIVADLVPESRRGRATAIVASGFSLASIFGVPAGLEMSRRGGWRAPFIVLGALTILLAAAVWLVLPRMRAHLDDPLRLQGLKLDAKVGWAFVAFGCSILGNFMLIPNISAYLQFNRDFPREHLGTLYLAGGLVSLVTMRLAGIWTDRSRALWPVLTGTVAVTFVLLFGAVIDPPWISPVIFFSVFMGFNAARWVSVNALATRVPAPSARARYLSAQNAFSHAASAAASFASVAFLKAEPSGRLIGFSSLAGAAALLGLGVPVAVWKLEKLLYKGKPEA